MSKRPNFVVINEDLDLLSREIVEIPEDDDGYKSHDETIILFTNERNSPFKIKLNDENNIHIKDIKQITTIDGSGIYNFLDKNNNFVFVLNLAKDSLYIQFIEERDLYSIDTVSNNDSKIKYTYDDINGLTVHYKTFGNDVYTTIFTTDQTKDISFINNIFTSNNCKLIDLLLCEQKVWIVLEGVLYRVEQLTKNLSVAIVKIDTYTMKDSEFIDVSLDTLKSMKYTIIKEKDVVVIGNTVIVNGEDVCRYSELSEVLNTRETFYESPIYRYCSLFNDTISFRYSQEYDDTCKMMVEHNIVGLKILDDKIKDALIDSELFDMNDEFNINVVHLGTVYKYNRCDIDYNKLLQI